MNIKFKKSKKSLYLLSVLVVVALILFGIIFGLGGFKIYQLLQKSDQFIDTSPQQLSRADIVAQWTPNVAYIVCEFVIDAPKIISLLSSNSISVAPVTLHGSGFLRSMRTEELADEKIAIITNRHVLNAHNGFSSPSSCEVTLPSGSKYLIDGDSIYFVTKGLKDEVKYIAGKPYVIPPIDAGYLIIKNPDIHIKELARKTMVCEISPRVGDDVIIIGYPSIGSTTGVTVTEGIVSGIENDYFVTSAKIERGNSGGVAIFKDKNCYFGIPTFARTGSIESLARILSFKIFFK